MGVQKRQIVRGIPQEIVERLIQAGGTTGHAEMALGYDYDSVCTAIDTEIYKLVVFEMLRGRHFDDDVFVYGFHDNAPRLQIKNGGSYGIPYRALRVAGADNLLATGMMITSNHDAHMSTRNTVSCMGQGQAAGTAAALAAAKNCGTRDLRYGDLRAALEKAKVYFEE